MDAFSGYNQIYMCEVDIPKTSFVTDQGIYCYRVMPFGLKNVGATYQRLVNKIFIEQIERNMEVYVDDILVKSKESSNHIPDLEESFQVLRKHNMKLNPSKCTFGVAVGKFLGFMVSLRGIEANPEKIQAVVDLNPPTTISEIQKLTGMPKGINLWVKKLTKHPGGQSDATTNQPLGKEAGTLEGQNLGGTILSSDANSTPQPGETDGIGRAEEKDEMEEERLWELQVDGSSNYLGSGAGLILTGPGNFIMDYAIRFGFQASNNQVRGTYEARDDRMRRYLAQVRTLADKFTSFKVTCVLRTENGKADILSKLATFGYTALVNIYIEFLKKSSIESEVVEVMQVDYEPCWMDVIINYLRSGELPEEKKKARQVIQRLARVSLDEENLYKRSYTLLYLKCLRPGDAAYMLQETHEGICGEHLGGKALATKVLLRGLYWPTLRQDSLNLVRKCERCQKFSPTVTNLPSQWPP
ncbi:uncharacterized protein LOC143853931 [Tasmannia lanceolata]|uniref:uncharacterized protein LOC143853931 n=1 Tax=Tasmannia lanceolata TaxID=3420 RepID=UPI0040641958